VELVGLLQRNPVRSNISGLVVWGFIYARNVGSGRWNGKKSGINPYQNPKENQSLNGHKGDTNVSQPFR
jgi:hypothetical protein